MMTATAGLTALDVPQNSGTDEPRPEQRTLKRIEADSRSYPLVFYRHAIPALLRRHRLRTERRADYRTSFIVPAGRQSRWCDLFDADAGSGVPFTYCNTSATVVLMRILSDAGVNFRHVRHAATDLTLPAGGYAPGTIYTLLVEVDRPVAVRDDRVTLTTRSRIQEPSGKAIATQTDTWTIGGLARGCTTQAMAPCAIQRRAWRTMMIRQPMTDGCDRLPIMIPDDLGRRYGRVAGDLNPTHLSERAARMFGSPRAFIQGFCTTNLTLAALWRAGHRPMSLRTSFIRPVHVDQCVELRVGAGELDLCDADGTLLMTGAWG